MINPINNYALTPAQPGVINEEAYTVLELVGKCGSKVNECVETVNTLESDVERTETKAELARTVAQEALRNAATAQTAADDAQDTADTALASIEEVSNATFSKANNIEIDFYPFNNNQAGQYGEFSQDAITFLTNNLAVALSKMKINFVPTPRRLICENYRFNNKAVPSAEHQGVWACGYLDIHVRYDPSDSVTASATFDLFVGIHTVPPYYGEVCYGHIIGSVNITPGNYSTNGIPSNAFSVVPYGDWTIHDVQI